MKLEKVVYKPRWNASKCRARLSRQVLRGHYEWCKKEGRDISWYEKQDGKRTLAR